MGICKVLAIIPFLCSAPAEEPEEQVIEAQPAPEVEVSTLTPPTASPSDSAPALRLVPDAEAPNVPDASPASSAVFTTATPPVRPVSEYQVLPPASGGAPVSEPATTQQASGENAGSFSEWVNQNWGDETDAGEAD